MVFFFVVEDFLADFLVVADFFDVDFAVDFGEGFLAAGFLAVEVLVGELLPVLGATRDCFSIVASGPLHPHIDFTKFVIILHNLQPHLLTPHCILVRSSTFLAGCFL